MCTFILYITELNENVYSDIHRLLNRFCIGRYYFAIENDFQNQFLLEVLVGKKSKCNDLQKRSRVSHLLLTTHTDTNKDKANEEIKFLMFIRKIIRNLTIFSFDLIHLVF
jgi:hypothetical protein